MRALRGVQLLGKSATPSSPNVWEVSIATYMSGAVYAKSKHRLQRVTAPGTRAATAQEPPALQEAKHPAGRGRRGAESFQWVRPAGQGPPAAPPLGRPAPAQPAQPGRGARTAQKKNTYVLPVAAGTAPVTSLPAAAAPPGRRSPALAAAKPPQALVGLYRKSKDGKSLQRRATARAAGPQRTLTWRNPALPPAGPRPAAAAVQPRRLSIGRTSRAAPRPAGGAAAAAASSSGKKRTWNKYVRHSRLQSKSPPAAPPPARQQPLRAARALPKGASSSSRSTTMQILSLGGSVYKVRGGAGHARAFCWGRPLATLFPQPVAFPALCNAACPQQVVKRSSGARSLQRQPSAGGAASLPERKTATTAAAAANKEAAAAAARARPSPGRPLKLKRLGWNRLQRRSLSAEKLPALRSTLAAKAGVRKQLQPAAKPAPRPKAAAAPPRRGKDGRGVGGITYCPLYCRTGTCDRRGKGCPYRHDPTKRSVCARWLRGCCADAACPLQHQRKPELMPACLHFLKVRKDLR